MKTGFDLAGNDDYEDKKNIVALVTLFGEHAIRTSFTYVKHAKRNGVTVEDIRRCIMLETFFFMKRPDVLVKAEEIKKQLFDNDSEEEEEDEEDDVETEEEMQVFKESECDCALCTCINKIDERWEKWTPQGNMEEILKKAVDHIGSIPSTENT